MNLRKVSRCWLNRVTRWLGFMLVMGTVALSVTYVLGQPPVGKWHSGSSNAVVGQAQSLSVTLDFSTFVGTTSAGGPIYQQLRDITFDSAGNIIVAGMGDFSTNGYPVSVPVKTFGTFGDGDAIIVAKLKPDGSQLLWVTLLGGNGLEKGGYGIAVDQSDNVYVAGTTHSSNFPTTPGAFDTSYNGPVPSGGDTFLAKLSPDGQTLIYSTYLGGGQGDETGRGGLAVDDQGFAYVVGRTASSDFLDQGGTPNPAKVNAFIGGQDDGYITKVSQDGSSIIYARYLGGTDNTGSTDVVKGVRVDAQGNAFMASAFNSSDAVTTDGSSSNGGPDIYLAKLSPDGTQLLYATYFGGSDLDAPGRRLWLDDAGNVYMVGSTLSTDMPMINGHQPNHGGGSVDAYLVKFNSAGQAVLSTYIGGSDIDDAWGPGLDTYGNIYVTGRTKSSNFEVTPNANDTTHNGDYDAFMQIYGPTGQLLYSTLLGGSGFDESRYVAVDGLGNSVMVGSTTSANFPATVGAYDRTHNGSSDAFIAKFNVVSTTPDPPSGVVYLPIVFGLTKVIITTFH